MPPIVILQRYSLLVTGWYCPCIPFLFCVFVPCIVRPGGPLSNLRRLVPSLLFCYQSVPKKSIFYQSVPKNIVDVSHHRHHRHWCTFIKPMLLLEHKNKTLKCVLFWLFCHEFMHFLALIVW